MRRLLAVSALGACLIAVAAGCGNGASDSTTAATAVGAGRAAAESSGATGLRQLGPAHGQGEEEGDREPSGGEGGGSGAGRGGHGAPAGRGPSEAPDRSLQTYGNEVHGRERAALAGAMRSFFRALAGRDYAAVCAGITEKARRQMQAYLAQRAGSQDGAGCPDLIAKLTAGNGSLSQELDIDVTHTRVNGGDGVVFFRRGAPVYYFAMVREDGGWRAVGVSFGTPLNPGRAAP